MDDEPTETLQVWSKEKTGEGNTVVGICYRLLTGTQEVPSDHHGTLLCLQGHQTQEKVA